MDDLFTCKYEENFPGADVAGESFVFLKAVERYQRRHARRYPTWREVLAIAHALGYRRVGPAAPEFEILYAAAIAPPPAGPVCREEEPS